MLTCGTAAEARERFGSANPDVVVLDYQLPDAAGLALLDELRPTAAGAVFLMATAYPDLDVAVDATVTVQSDVRWVDAGRIVTAAGVAAGIDMAFHLVERLCGREVADETARYIEFPRAARRRDDASG